MMSMAMLVKSFISDDKRFKLDVMFFFVIVVNQVINRQTDRPELNIVKVQVILTSILFTKFYCSNRSEKNHNFRHFAIHLFDLKKKHIKRPSFDNQSPNIIFQLQKKKIMYWIYFYKYPPQIGYKREWRELWLPLM